MARSLSLFLGLAGVVVGLPGLLGGCLPPRMDAYTVTQSIQVDPLSTEADRLWTAAQEVLRRHRFELDRVDRPRGVISTMQETSQHFFEVWRRDVATREDFWEAGLNLVRRRVDVTVGPAELPEDPSAGMHSAGDDSAPWERISVRVHVQRISRPDRQFNSSAAGYGFFGSELPSVRGATATEADETWVDVGRDHALESRLLEEILRLAGGERTSSSTAD